MPTEHRSLTTDSWRKDIEELGEAIAETAAHLDAATHRLLTQIRHFDEAEGWGVQGAVSCAQWLNWRVGIALGAAREKVRVARKLSVLPRVDEALRKGALSYSSPGHHAGRVRGQ